MHRSQLLWAPALAASTLAAVVALTANDAHAAGIIKNPGDHPSYGVELEPHGLLRWDSHYGDYYGSTGYGLGMHAVIPFLDNGPIDRINNNMGIGFGLDWAHYSQNYCYAGPFFIRGAPANYSCDVYGNGFMFPIFVQWNFFLTDIISVFGEAGFGIADDTVNANYYLGVCPIGANCTYSDSQIDVFPYFEPGARFLFGRAVGLVVRVGYPILTVGVTFLL